ncbi:hypothetical protein EDP2_3837 [Enterobacter cloacae S611]|uniref:Uncharacterized protein n=1 Tax=Enterobacter cloacae S611 TaxID=1399146 RepID=A0ABP2ZTG2_ENTCL|nr:hypothetical protein EDP2_3837 [Enterobacter cloacae S611]
MRQQLSGFLIAQLFCQRAERAVRGNFVMLYFLRRGNQAGIAQGAFFARFDHFVRFFNQTFHRVTLHAFQFHVGFSFQQHIDTFNLTVGLFEMLFKGLYQFSVRGFTRHFGQCARQLLLGAVNVRQTMNKKVVKRINLHNIHPIIALKIASHRWLASY